MPKKPRIDPSTIAPEYQKFGRVTDREDQRYHRGKDGELYSSEHDNTPQPKRPAPKPN